MAVRQPARADVPYAEVNIPTDWLMPSLDLEVVRSAQRSDSEATLTSEFLSLKGLELTLERRWLREDCWRQIKQTIAHGYIYKSTGVQVTLRGERREHERHVRATSS